MWWGRDVYCLSGSPKPEQKVDVRLSGEIIYKKECKNGKNQSVKRDKRGSF
jgi:hypothetical protein